ncbi:MAG: hypothetical protein PHP62_06215, partial [Candidatus Moranbacteria bacterium]|nr:hypothetical protein [Candidatus Moranbacteria bacterium]
METEKEKKQSKIVEKFKGVPNSEEAHFGVEENESEALFQSFQKKKVLKKKILKIAGSVAVVFLMIIAGVSVYFRNKNSQQIAAPIKQAQIEIPQDKEHIIVNETGDVSKEKDVPAVDDSRGIAGKSENFKIKDIA